MTTQVNAASKRAVSPRRMLVRFGLTTAWPELSEAEK